MRTTTRPRLACVLSLALAASTAAASAALPAGAYHNVTTGGPLRPDVYGRIEVRGQVPPPVIFKQPVVASSALDTPRRSPVYLYVPPGQVRHWKRNCAKWKACDVPVLFVRVADSPSRWGQWRQWREQMALHGDASD